MADTRPNILLILTDQQRGDCLGIEGHPVLQTPNLDALARSGTHFRRGYSECPSCVPARRTLMTGQAPAVQGMVGYQDHEEWDPPHTLAGELSQAGYQTELVGKLHFWPRRKRYGFQHMRWADGPHGLDGPMNDYARWLRRCGLEPLDAGSAHGASANGWVGRPSHLPESQSHTTWCVNEAVDFLDRRDPSVPFFLNVSFFQPHPPLAAPQFYYDRYIQRELPPPVVGDWAPHFEGPEKGIDVNSSRICLDEETMRCARAAYYGMINHIDDQVGRLVNFMKRRRLFGNTFVLFTSDHGEMLGDHNLFRKTFAYEASARVPFLTRAPQSAELPGEVATFAPVGWQDVMPTLLDVAGVPIPPTVTGRSVLPLMRGDESGWREVLHGEHAGCYRYEDGVHFLTDGHWKYIWYSQTGREHLFNLDEDPNELTDLAAVPAAEGPLAPWRKRLVETLSDRPEGFVAGQRLIPGKPHKPLVPKAG